MLHEVRNGTGQPPTLQQLHNDTLERLAAVETQLREARITISRQERELGEADLRRSAIQEQLDLARERVHELALKCDQLRGAA
jgi:chromosome segregation ATPase